jgi:hypothetical protein
MSMQLNLTGTSMTVKIKNKYGLPVELYQVPTALMTPQPPSTQCPFGAYRVSPAATRVSWQDDSFVDMVGYQRLAGCLIDARDLITVRWPHPIWKDEGYGPITASALTTDSAEQIERARWSHFKRGFMPDIALIPPADTNPDDDEIDRICAIMSAKFGGVENKGKVFVGPGGATIEQLGRDAEEMGYVESWPQLRDAIMAIHGTPGIAAGIQDGGSYAAFYASLLQFIRLTVQPELTWVALEWMHQLAPYFGEDIEIGLQAQSIDDPNLLEQQLKTDIESGSIRRREYRAVRGLEPLGNDSDDELIGKTTEKANVAGQVASGQPANADGNATGTGLPGVERSAVKSRRGRNVMKAIRELAGKVEMLSEVVAKPKLAKRRREPAAAAPTPSVADKWKAKPADERQPWEYV